MAIGVLSDATQQHVALSRVSGNTRMFVDGTQVGPTYVDVNSYITAPVTIGQQGHSLAGANGLVGYVDDLRVTNGVGRWSAPFTAPTIAAGLYLDPEVTAFRVGNAAESTQILGADITAFADFTAAAILTAGSYFNLAPFTDAQLDDITDAVNTDVGKVAGAMVYNSDQGYAVTAQGNTDGALWVDGVGTTVNTPV